MNLDAQHSLCKFTVDLQRFEAKSYFDRSKLVIFSALNQRSLGEYERYEDLVFAMVLSVQNNANGQKLFLGLSSSFSRYKASKVWGRVMGSPKPDYVNEPIQISKKYFFLLILLRTSRIRCPIVRNWSGCRVMARQKILCTHTQ